MIGTRLAHFDILAKLGEGGMGEVWRARDTRLGREVAIKVLPQTFVSDPDRLARFEREARLLASLSHPHIAGIFEVGEGVPEAIGSDDADLGDGESAPHPRPQRAVPTLDRGFVGRRASVHYLVMELAEGETLAERLQRGPLPAEEVFEIAGQIAAAVAAAHDQGVIHRDLKPGNVMVAPDGTVKVLDFGLAKALGEDPGSGSGPELAASPTLTFQPTTAGMLLGTAAYLSPEQAKGRPADRRSDVWAWGCILYEMLTATQPFSAESVAESLAKTLQSEPDYELLPVEVRGRVEPLLRRCLTKDPRSRLRDVGDAQLLLEQDVSEVEPESRTPAAARWRERLAWIAAALAVAFGLATIWLGGEARKEPEAAQAAFDITLPDDRGLSLLDEPNLAIARDARSVAFVAEDPGSGERMLYMRRLDDVEARVLPGTEGASAPFFSPDGRWLGFFAQGRLAKIPSSGGAVVSLAADVNAPRGAVWLPDDSIVYSPLYATGLWRIPSSGGVPKEILPVDGDAGERTFRWPDAWPDGRSILFTVGSVDSPNDYDEASIALWDPDTDSRTTLVEGANMARFVPPDRLLFFRDNVLYAVPVDVAERRVVGSAVPVLEGVIGDPSSGAAYFAVAADGSLAFAPGVGNAEKAMLTLVERDGSSHALELEPRPFHHPRFSPDGSRLAFTVGVGRGGASGDVWTWSLKDGVLGRLTFEETGVYPAWDPAGQRIAYNSGTGKIAVKAASGAGESTDYYEGSGLVALPSDWSVDGTMVMTVLGGGSPDLYLLREGGEPELFETDASSPRFSPDGRWIAYQSPGSGINNLYVRSVEGSGKWQIAAEPGSYPHWGSTGELFYLGVGSRGRPLRVVTVEPVGTGGSAGLRFGPPRTVLEDTTTFRTAAAPLVNFDVDPSGKRFVFVEPVRGDEDGKLVRVVLGWGSSLDRSDTRP